MHNIGGHGPHIPFVSGLAEHGSRTALIAGTAVISFSQLAAVVAETADRLGRVRRLVMIEGSNDVDTVVTYLGALAGGHAVMLVADDERRRDDLVSAYGPDVLAARDGAEWSLVEHCRGTTHDLHPDLALVLSTSGSTGSPKSVRLSHTNLQSNAEAIVDYLGLSAADRAITTLPIQYCYGLSVIHTHLTAGAAVVLSTNSVVDDCFWNDVREHGVTGFAGVPHTFDLLDRVGFDEIEVPTLRYLTQAGGRLAPEKVERYARLADRDGWQFFVMYGQTEATARMAYLPPEHLIEHPGAIGVPVPGGSFELVPEDGADGTDEGELVYRGPNVMLGYATAAADLGTGRTVEALHTGDLARRSTDGLIEIIGRSSRFTKLFGLRVDLDHVERVLGELGISGLCAGDDERLLVAVRDADPGRTKSALSERLGIPGSAIQVARVEELPYLPNGKPDHRAVRDLVCLPGSPLPAASDEGAAGVRDLFRTLLGVSEIRDRDTFVSLGGDSLSYVELSIGLERRLGRLPPNWHMTPVGDLRRLDRRRSRLHQVETTVVLRAVAIVMIVGSHAALFRVRGGAHVLLAVAGYNFARFQLDSSSFGVRAVPSLSTVWRVAAPAAIWLGLLSLVTTEYGWTSVALLNSYLGPPEWSPAWRFWFIEALVLTLLVCTATFAVPAIRRLERTNPAWFAAAVLGSALLLRFDVIPLGASPEPLLVPHRVVWFFVLGWFIQRATTSSWRIVATAVTVAAVPGFFGEPTRDAVVIAGLLFLIWVPSIGVPRPLNRIIGVLAAASLYIYLTHWQVYLPLVERGLAAWAAVAASLLVGTAVWWLASLRRSRPTADSSISRHHSVGRHPATTAAGADSGNTPPSPAVLHTVDDARPDEAHMSELESSPDPWVSTSRPRP